MSTVCWSEEARWFNRLCTNPLQLERPPTSIELPPEHCHEVCVNPFKRLNPICAYHTCGPVEWPNFFHLDLTGFSDAATNGRFWQNPLSSVCGAVGCGPNVPMNGFIRGTEYWTESLQDMGSKTLVRPYDDFCTWYGGIAYELQTRRSEESYYYPRFGPFANTCQKDCDYLYEETLTPIEPWKLNRNYDRIIWEDSCIRQRAFHIGDIWKLTISQGSSGNDLRFTVDFIRYGYYTLEQQYYLTQPGQEPCPNLCCGSHRKNASKSQFDFPCDRWGSASFINQGLLASYLLDRTCDTEGPWTLRKNYDYGEDIFAPSNPGCGIPTFPEFLEVTGTPFVPPTGTGGAPKTVCWSQDSRYFQPLCTNQLLSEPPPNSMLVPECPDLCIGPYKTDPTECEELLYGEGNTSPTLSLTLSDVFRFDLLCAINLCSSQIGNPSEWVLSDPCYIDSLSDLALTIKLPNITDPGDPHSCISSVSDECEISRITVVGSFPFHHLYRCSLGTQINAQFNQGVLIDLDVNWVILLSYQAGLDLSSNALSYTLQYTLGGNLDLADTLPLTAGTSWTIPRTYSYGNIRCAGSSSPDIIIPPGCVTSLPASADLTIVSF